MRHRHAGVSVYRKSYFAKCYIKFSTTWLACWPALNAACIIIQTELWGEREGGGGGVETDKPTNFMHILLKAMMTGQRIEQWNQTNTSAVFREEERAQTLDGVLNSNTKYKPQDGADDASSLSPLTESSRTQCQFLLCALCMHMKSGTTN